MSEWRAELRLELTTNSQKMLAHCQRSVASRIDDTFPKQHIIDLYINPLTSWSAIPPNIPNTGLWISREPSLRDFTIFCSDKLLLGYPCVTQEVPEACMDGHIAADVFCKCTIIEWSI